LRDVALTRGLFVTVRLLRRAARKAGFGRARSAGGVAAYGELQRRAERLGQRMFLGGPVELFEQFGRLQLEALVSRGLTTDSYVLDTGCGALRAGYWLIHFLEPGRYLGIEPNQQMLAMARAEILEPGLEEEKQPRFAFNDDFDLGVFGVAPDFVLARSIWTHASKEQIERMLASFASVAAPNALLLASYLRPRRLLRDDYGGQGWVGRGHQSDKAGVVSHSFEWIATTCRRLGLGASESRADNFGNQVWIEVRRFPA
jgi:SAM-dependent methyltransferase